MTYSVLTLKSCDDDGRNKIYALAARQPMSGEARKMDYGQARGLTLEDAQNTATKLRLGAGDSIAIICEDSNDHP